MSFIEEIVPVAALTPAVMSIYMSSPDAIDKTVKGVGSAFKLTSVAYGVSSYGRVAARCSQLRSVMRMSKWYEKLGSIDTLTGEEGWFTLRNALLVFRIMFDALYIFLDNVTFLGMFLAKDNQTLTFLAQVARASLFWGFAFAMLMELHDIFLVSKEKRKIRKIKISQNALELLSGLGNVCSLEFGALTVAAMVCVSSAISIRDQLLIAHQKHAKKSV